MMSKFRDSNKGLTATGLIVAALLLAVVFTNVQTNAATAQETTPQNSFENTESIAPTISPAGKLGAFPFYLTVSPSIGKIIYTFDQNDKSLKTIDAKLNVTFVVEGTTITCGQLNYDLKTATVVANGPGLNIEFGGPDVSAFAECDHLTYRLAENTMELKNTVITKTEKSGVRKKTTGLNVKISAPPGTPLTGDSLFFP